MQNQKLDVFLHQVNENLGLICLKPVYIYILVSVFVFLFYNYITYQKTILNITPTPTNNTQIIHSNTTAEDTLTKVLGSLIVAVI